jgi:flagellar biosynthesis GTPase FlhF
MRIFIYFIFSVVISASVIAQAGIPVAFLDVSAGVFRFQSRLAEQGNPEAQYKVGEMHETGKGVNKNIKKARQWFEKAAASGHQKASYKIIYLDIAETGLNSFTRSQLGKIRNEAAVGNPNAQYILGRMYTTGVGVPRSLQSALIWLNKAKFNGVIEAEHDGILVEEKLAQIKQQESRRRAVALAATAKKKKAEEEKSRQLQKEKDRALAKKRSEQRRKDARTLAEKKRREKEKAALAAIEKDRQQQAKIKQREARVKQQKVSVKETQKNEKKPNATFVSDPCAGKKARFLSTCK